MIRVLVIATSLLVRSGLEALFHANPAFTLIVGTLKSPQNDALPDVLLVEGAEEDQLPELLSHGLPVVLLVDDLGWALEAIRAGVRGVLPDRATAEEIYAALESVACGLVVLHPDALDSVPPVMPPRMLPTTTPLSPREIEVLEMLAEGLGNKTIAKRLHISEHTVKFHISSIFTKLHATSRTEAVTLGARQGLIML
jgi:two-component system, NarL family, response regulator YdfI